MKKEFVKLSKRLLPVLLAVIMLASVGGNFAFAASSGPNTAAPSTDVGEEVKVVTGMVSSAVFFSTGKVYTLDTNYWTIGSNAHYDPYYGTEVASFQLSNWAKIARLMNMLYPADQIPDEIARLTEYNKLDSLKRRITSGQKQPIWNYLSTATRKKIANMDAEHALMHVKRQPEYARNADLRQYVDEFLKWTLSGPQLRWGLRVLFPDYTYAISTWDLRSLLNFAQCVVNTAQYQQLYARMKDVSNGNHDVQSLLQRFTYSQAKMYELGLSLAADYYLHDAVYALETWEIVLPTTMVSNVMPNATAVPDVDDPDGGVGTIIDPDERPVPSIPVAEARTPKYYR